MKVLRTALVGLGRIGWYTHLPKIIETDGFEAVAAVDTNDERLNELETTYGIAGYKDLSEMLNAQKPDLVVIASPTHLHMEHAICAMEHGADVFLDKPAARNLDEVLKIREAAERTGRKIMVFQPCRANAATNLLADIIKQGKIGDVFMVKRARIGYSRRNDWQARREFGGGMLINYGAHHFDEMRYLLGEKLELKLCLTHTVATLGDAEDVVKAVFKTKSGITVDVDINQACGTQLVPWQVFGKYGAISSGEVDGKPCFTVRYLDPEELPEISLQEGFAAQGRRYSPDSALPWRVESVEIPEGDAFDYYAKCYDYFALDKEPFLPFEQTVELLATIDECRAAAEGI